ncbi:hypothetical protein AU377_13995 [Sporosarcina sp. HYO08]|nr:hypothetical protein AU377_13995 [Sporosarcina sp. HYO08]
MHLFGKTETTREAGACNWMSQILKGVKEGNLSSPRPESALISAKYAETRQIELFAVRLATVA